MPRPSTTKKNIIEVHAIFRGRVQGVGFRITVRQHAERLGLQGTVRNLNDGTVEVYAQGSKESIQDLFQALHREFGPGHILNIDQEQITSLSSYEDFKILH